jgi:hypothetical protein
MSVTESALRAVGDVGTLKFGYRGEVLSGVHDFEIEGGELHSYQVTHGPVLEFLGSFQASQFAHLPELLRLVDRVA